MLLVGWLTQRPCGTWPCLPGLGEAWHNFETQFTYSTRVPESCWTVISRHPIRFNNEILHQCGDDLGDRAYLENNDDNVECWAAKFSNIYNRIHLVSVDSIASVVYSVLSSQTRDSKSIIWSLIIDLRPAYVDCCQSILCVQLCV